MIALIITIIVMLILVAVSVSVALNGGLFDKATDASTKTEKETIYEQIIANSYYTNDGYIDVQRTFTDFVNSYEDKTKINPNTIGSGETSKTFEVTGKRGTYTYTIKTDEILIGTATQNPWITRGLKSSNVKFNTLYSELVEEGRTCYFVLYDNGDLGWDFGSTINVLDHDTGNYGGTSSQIDSAIGIELFVGYDSIAIASEVNFDIFRFNGTNLEITPNVSIENLPADIKAQIP